MRRISTRAANFKSAAVISHAGVSVLDSISYIFRRPTSLPSGLVRDEKLHERQAWRFASRWPPTIHLHLLYLDLLQSAVMPESVGYLHNTSCEMSSRSWLFCSAMLSSTYGYSIRAMYPGSGYQHHVQIPLTFDGESHAAQDLSLSDNTTQYSVSLALELRVSI